MQSLVSIEQQSPRRPCDNTLPPIPQPWHIAHKHPTPSGRDLVSGIPCPPGGIWYQGYFPPERAWDQWPGRNLGQRCRTPLWTDITFPLQWVKMGIPFMLAHHMCTDKCYLIWFQFSFYWSCHSAYRSMDLRVPSNYCEVWVASPTGEMTSHPHSSLLVIPPHNHPPLPRPATIVSPCMCMKAGPLESCTAGTSSLMFWLYARG